MTMKQPLADRLRPKNIDDYIGQNHLVGNSSVLRQAIKAGVFPSIILWGPPGVGKTTLAQIIAKQLKREIFTLSAINSGVKDVRDVIEKSKARGLFGTNSPVLFIDEIHRFSKSQQDSLLGAVETGIITLVGATTENPSFEVIPALLSRCQVYKLEHFSVQDLKAILDRAIYKDSILSTKNIKINEYDDLLRLSGGDARKLLNIFELIVNSHPSECIVITDKLVQKYAKQVVSSYDKDGPMHYDIASALIKSIRGSDPNASVYWLARMIEGGEDVKFIARRLLIAASEDIGNANPTALVIANNCFQAVSSIGYPESRIILAQCVTYLASSVKSNASYQAINKAQELVKQTGSLSVPIHLRNAPTKLMKDLDYGKEYNYPHNIENSFIEQEYLPNELEGTKLYDPSDNSRERAMREFLKLRWKDKYNY